MYKSLIFCSLFLIVSDFLNISDKQEPTDRLNPPFLCCDTNWADSVFTTLTPDDRIAQLFMVAAYSNKGPSHVEKISKLIGEYKIGGLIFFKGGPLRQALPSSGQPPRRCFRRGWRAESSKA